MPKRKGQVLYNAPILEQSFVLKTIASLREIAGHARFSLANDELVDAILQQAGKLAGEVFGPLCRSGDIEGARWEDGNVVLPNGFRDAYNLYREGGWASLHADPDTGGQGLPFALSCAVQEQLTSANMAFALCMMLSQGAIHALSHHASEELQRRFLSRLVSGEWTGTMNLTEPQAGSDVGALRTQATPDVDGRYRISGEKIFITWGDHDVAENIVHLVLARLPGAPVGTKGISLFLVPKFLVNDDGTLGNRNGVSCRSLERKLGIHASPTCTMQFGDESICFGWLVGEENQGMAAMFTMMNHARINVGLQGVAIAERAYQRSVKYAYERQQHGRLIATFPDVRRMLMTMRANTQAARALVYYTASQVDLAAAAAEPVDRRQFQCRADLLTPVAKSWATDLGVETTSLGIQVLGGLGYIEDSGAAQDFRDARIAPIYEGTNGIQAIDLVARKLGIDDGRHWRELFAEIENSLTRASLIPTLESMASALRSGLEAVSRSTLWLTSSASNLPDQRLAAASAYLRIFGNLVGGWLLLIEAEATLGDLYSQEYDRAFLDAKVATAKFFAEQIVAPQSAISSGLLLAGSGDYQLSGDQMLSR
ncbi:acyl-CoA dehydrogenase (plasmid) [Sphingobium sp. SCG-1]|uniref:acyl-CoA dehydrogenase n=1 Tax=Sphingobium sp. SCG-1 TaxID=2072936 RepID=UPI000CD6815D|nr:acyl-CoA dehydrogenase [Sphingobium sp. SCG-1]AUW60614.1 acyl-CoA dehydrogenase [Sphingobium sp. SCG-1]